MGKLLNLTRACHLQAAQSFDRPISVLNLHAMPSSVCSELFVATRCTDIPVDDAFLFPSTLPFPSESFDLVIYQGIVDNSLDLNKLVSEVYRVLRHDGVFTFDATQRNIWSWLQFVIFERILQVEPTGYRNWRLFVDSEEMTRVLNSKKFSILSSEWYAAQVDVVGLIRGDGILDSIVVGTVAKYRLNYCMKAKKA